MAGKSPAPVLPAMGLHSFHNDSPPFAAAGVAASDPDSEMFSLDGAVSHVHSRQTSNERPGIGPRAASTSRIPAMPITQRGFHNALLSNQHHPAVITTSGGGRSERLATGSASDDEQLSSSRSRTLISGYMFGGNPPSPSFTREQSPTGLQADARNQDATKVVVDRRDRARTPTPPNADQRLDSPPLSDITGETTMQALARLAVDDQETKASIHNNMIANGQATASEGTRRNQSVVEGSQGGAGSQRGADRSSSQVRDMETGYDRLNGLNDGEADLDESAPQANGFSSEDYLRTDGPRAEYQFPRHRLRTTMKDESKIPLVIVACGSFSPPTYLHLRMFEMAKDEIVESQTFEIMAGYYSPVSSYYKKSGLAPAIHRVRMCELAVEHTSTWLMVDPWEAGQPEYQRTAVVLEHFNEMLNGEGGGVVMSDGRKRKYKIMLLAGGDLIESFGEPGVWSEPDLHIILGRFGCLIVERAGSDVWAFLLSHDILYSHRRNVIVIKQLIYNDISSTKVRLFVRRGMSIKYLLPNSVIQYIYDHKLYRTSETKTITA